LGDRKATGTRAAFQTLTCVGRQGDLTDADLLARASRAGGDREVVEASFSTLIGRHGPMVLGVCRAILRNHHDAEDAFQATFFLLVQRAGRLPLSGSVGPWLHEVAVRVCLAARRARGRRPASLVGSDFPLIDRKAGGDNPLDAIARDEAAASLHAAIDRLPTRFRSCVVLCDLEGMSYAQAARILSVPVGTVQSRLARARGRLRDQLGKSPSDKGQGEASGALAATWTLVPPALAGRTTSLCTLLGISPGALPAGVCPAVASLMKGATRMRPILGFTPAAVLVTAAMLAGSLAVFSQTARREARSMPQPHAPAQASSLAPREVEASAARGRIVVYDLDREGNRREIPAQKADPRASGAGMVAAMLRGMGTKESNSRVSQAAYKEIDLETTWALVIGVIPNREILKGARAIGARPEDLLPFYRRVELSRQEQAQDGSWSDWRLVDPAPTLKLLDNIPEEDEELLPPDFRLENLVDPLPHRTDRRWSRVNPERFLLKIPFPDEVFPLRPETDVNRLRLRTLESDELMFRSFDFSVVPGRTYRYRARLVVLPPRNQRRGEAFGEWSQPTEAVTAP
jgi:RNA polymerase sigma factor (sigma-70 family)